MGVQRRVVIGMDPHKRSVTVEVMEADETIVGHGRFGTDVTGFAQLVGFAGQWPDRVWAIEGCEGIGRHVAQRLLAAGEQVVDVPAKLSARMRMFATGQGRKTDDTDAHSIALVGVRISGLQPVVADEQLEMLRLQRIYLRKKQANKELITLLKTTNTGLLDLHGIGPSGAATLLVEVGDITRFPNRGHFASWTGTAPIDVSSGDKQHHRLSRGGNRQINMVLHMMAVVQLRNPTQGRAYYDRKVAAGKSPNEAMRCLKRRLSDIVYRAMLDDYVTTKATGPGGHRGASLQPSAAGSHPHTSTSDKPLPGPVTQKPTTRLPKAS